MMEYDIIHIPARFRFETTVDGHVAFLQYILTSDAIDIVSTFVPAAIGGRGIAGSLVRVACEYATSRGLKIIPTCSYVKVWLKRHPEYGF